MQKKRLVAIVPAYNEAARIQPILETLNSVREIDEIIVVDDGSTDNLQAVVDIFPEIRYIRNKKNLGKGASMDAAVKKTASEFILFCDADLTNLKQSHIQKIIKPVIDGTYDMYIGSCGNTMQQAIKPWSLNSGQRMLKRSIWEQLPQFYKKGYRIETGLNLFVKYFGKGYGHTALPYSQYIKEKKHGFLTGFFMRNKMNFEILFITLRFLLYDQCILKRKGFRIK